MHSIFFHLVCCLCTIALEYKHTAHDCNVIFTVMHKYIKCGRHPFMCILNPFVNRTWAVFHNQLIRLKFNPNYLMYNYKHFGQNISVMLKQSRING